MPFTVESKAAAFFNIFNAQVDSIVESNDTTPPFVYSGDSPTNMLISTDQDLTVKVNWQVNGLIPAISKLDYTLTLYANHSPVASTVVTSGPLNPGVAAALNAAVTFTPGAPGIYSLSAGITVKVSGAGGFNLPVAGFKDLGSLKVYPG